MSDEKRATVAIAVAVTLRSAAQDLYRLAAQYMARAEELDPEPEADVDECTTDLEQRR